MTRHRRHPAQASRIVAAGLSTATMLGIVAVLGAQPSAGTPEGSAAALAPAKVAVVIRIPAGTTGRQAQTPQAGQPPDTTTRPS